MTHGHGALQRVRVLCPKRLTVLGVDTKETTEEKLGKQISDDDDDDDDPVFLMHV